MTYYLGRPGALVALPDPEVGLSFSTDRIGGTHQLLGGPKVRDTIGYSRTYQLSWTAIDAATYSLLDGFYRHAMGPGPYAFIDPDQKNLLSANVSSGGDAFSDATGFAFGANVTGGANFTHNSNPGGVYSIILNETSSVGAAQDVVIGADVIPVVVGLSYTFQAVLWLAASGPSHAVQIQWLDPNLSSVGTVTGNTVAAGASGLQSIATGTAPGTAAYAQVRVRSVTANTSGATQFSYTDGWQLEQGASASAWQSGRGPMLVTVESLSASVPLAGICDVQMTLVQVARAVNAA